MIQSYNAESNSGHKPGLGICAASAVRVSSLAPGEVSGALGVHGELQGFTGEGQRLGDRIAYNLAELVVRERWISPSSVPSRGFR
jgi:hypothetical protein